MAIDKGNGPEGSMGNIVHYMLKGKKVMRLKPAHMTNPQTTAQTNHRTKIILSSRFVKAMNNFIKIGYQATSLDYPSNEARQYLMKKCFAITEAGPLLEYHTVVLSRGEIRKPEDTEMSINDTSANVSWKKPVPGDYNDGSDKVMIAIFSEEGEFGTSWLLSNVALRMDGNAVLQIPVHTKPIHVWMFFHNAEKAVGESRKKVSDSVYLGEIE